MHLLVRLCGLLALTFTIAACASGAGRNAASPPAPEMAMATLDVASEDVYVRIVDVGPGLCAIVKVPGGKSMVYDAGHWNGQHCIKAVQSLIPGEIDLLFISHSDADHLGDAARILQAKRVRQTILAGEVRTTASWTGFMNALANEVKAGGSVMNLQSVALVPGTRIPLGEAVVTLIAGWGEWTAAGPTESERRNAISVVARLEYRGRSILFTGDTVGRRLNDNDAACKDAEKVMVDRHTAGDVSLKSDVIVASHHGANNGNAACFINAVDPDFVIFPAGHDHGHPTANAASRYIAAGVAVGNFYGTDFGDDEGGAFEWPMDRVSGCSDPAGDDDIEVALRENGTVDVDYLRTARGCDSRTGD